MSEKKKIIVPKPGQLLAELAGGAANEAFFSAMGFAGADANKSAVDSINDFTRMKMKEEGFCKKILPPLEMGVDWAAPFGGDPVKFEQEYLNDGGGETVVGGITKEDLVAALKMAPHAFAADAAAMMKDLKTWDESFDVGDKTPADIAGLLSANAIKDILAEMDGDFFKVLPINDVMADAANEAAVLGGDYVVPAHEYMEDPTAEVGVDIVFWYYRKTDLIYSIRRVADNYFYDFATKTFKLLPVCPRAGMPRAEPTQPSGYIYSTRLSGKLADGEYVTTIRDGRAEDVVVGIMALFMQGGVQQETPPQGLENTPIEEGIPSPAGTYTRAARRVRPVDTGGV